MPSRKTSGSPALHHEPFPAGFYRDEMAFGPIHFAVGRLNATEKNAQKTVIESFISRARLLSCARKKQTQAGGPRRADYAPLTH
jgi:hypothetical protein